MQEQGAEYLDGTIMTFPESQVTVNKIISGNTIILSTEKSKYSQLQNISSATLIYFETSAHNASTGFSDYDYYPSYSTLTNIPNNRTNYFTHY